jgi:hypothetical protein
MMAAQTKRFERVSAFTGGFLGFSLLFAIIRARKEAREKERNDEPTPAGQMQQQAHW